MELLLIVQLQLTMSGVYLRLAVSAELVVPVAADLFLDAVLVLRVKPVEEPRVARFAINPAGG